MSADGFTTTLSVDQSPQAAFDAVTDVRGWWSEDVQGGTAHPGAEFTYRYGDVHHCRIRVTDVVPGRTVSWLVLDNHFTFVQDPAEWTGTTIDFEIAERDGRTEVRFTHHGLVPEFECYESCSDGWGFYINHSLRNLIATGKGAPNGSEQPGTEAEAVAARDR